MIEAGNNRLYKITSIIQFSVVPDVSITIEEVVGG